VAAQLLEIVSFVEFGLNFTSHGALRRKEAARTVQLYRDPRLTEFVVLVPGTGGDYAQIN
jgi:hypothetical protein